MYKVEEVKEYTVLMYTSTHPHAFSLTHSHAPTTAFTHNFELQDYTSHKPIGCGHNHQTRLRLMPYVNREECGTI